MTLRTLKFSALTLALTSALVGGYGLAHLNGLSAAHAAAPPTLGSTQSIPNASGTLPDMASIVAVNGPAVVNISVSGTRKVKATPFEAPELDPSDPFFRFFRHFGMPTPRGGEEVVRGEGSGFIVTTDGTILTNAHVVDGADEVTVKLTDKREFRAKVKGLDKDSDVAVLKIEADQLPTVRLGQAASTRVGEWVLAIGSPFGFENSASAGIVSAKSRSLPDGSYVPFIQTDVAVNPGNSGGPLFNMRGEVIGINSQIYSRSGGYQGLSFAIPIEVATNVQKQILADGRVHRGRLGITIQDINQGLAESFGLDRPKGALVNQVDRRSPAALAGLKPGDVILKIDDQEIGASGELPAAIAQMKPGQAARLTIWRDHQAQVLAVTIGEFKETS